MAMENNYKTAAETLLKTLSKEAIVQLIRYTNAPRNKSTPATREIDALNEELLSSLGPGEYYHLGKTL